MHWIDILIFIVYMGMMLGVGFYFMLKNKDQDDYFVGGRKMGSLHVGLSVVATDVGGGFSIGLGGLGFAIGLSGSWMLATGLLGAWLSAVIMIPKISRLGKKLGLLTFPQVFLHYYGAPVAILAGIISTIGYIGFTSSQLLAGAKLASSTFEILDLNTALIIMGAIAVIYTALGGLKAVIYTDTVQWILLMAGLIFLGIPISYYAVGGWEGISNTLPESFLSLTNVGWRDLVNWSVTIIPIWFVGMTLYQRIFSCKSEKHAKRAWFIAGLFEYPVMAFLGVVMGLFARVAYENGLFAEFGFAKGAEIDGETGIPLLLRTVLPVGLMGLMMSAFFSAIMSTADSCLMAASGNIMTDVFGKLTSRVKKNWQLVLLSQFVTLMIGVIALLIGLLMENVLELMLLSYAFMVSGLFVPVLGVLFWKRRNMTAAFISMLAGGLTTIFCVLFDITALFELNPNIYGILVSLVFFVLFSLILPGNKSRESI